MPLHLGSRIHAFLGGLGQPSEAKLTGELYGEVEASLARHGLADEAGRGRFVERLTDGVLDGLRLERDHPQRPFIQALVGQVLVYEKMFKLPDYQPSGTYPTARHFELRDELREQQRYLERFDETFEHLRLFFCHVLDPVFEAVPQLREPKQVDGIRVPTSLMHMVGDMGSVVEKMARAVSIQEFQEAGLFRYLQGKLDYNLILASGGNPSDPRAFTRAPKYPSKSDIRDPAALHGTYLGGTPLLGFFDQKIAFTLPTSARFEHHHIVAGSGHGKTQTLQYLIARDIEEVRRGNRSVVVLDSQGDLIRNISNLAVFAPGGALHERIVIIDPTDVEYPVSLNLFDVGQDRLSGYSPLERERLTNSILELYDFVLGSLLDAGMTQKQSVIFRYVTRLMLHIPDATIHTLRELMEPGAEVKFARDIAKLSGSARHFFETEFSSREFEQTKKQVLRRLWGILENQTFERMFSHPQSKLDLFSEMNAGKVILINTAKDLLKESGTEIFGRFFIALMAQAAQERAVLPTHQRTPTMVYIDEAADYFDRNIGIILSTARKYNVGMVLAHQYLSQLTPALQEAFSANTTIKFAGGVSAKDARTLAGQMYCEPSLIEAQKKGAFAAHIRGYTPTAIPLSFPFGYMEDLPRMSFAERDALQECMRELYAVHYSELGDVAEPEQTDEATENIDPNEPTPYW